MDNEEQCQFSECIGEVVGSDIKLKNFIRLGKEMNRDPLLLHMQLSNPSEKRKLLSKAKHFKDSKSKVAKSVVFQQDQTPEERFLWKKLIVKRNQIRETFQIQEEKEWQTRNKKVVRVAIQREVQIERSSETQTLK